MKSWVLGIVGVLCAAVGSAAHGETVGVSLQSADGGSGSAGLGGFSITANLGSGNVKTTSAAGDFNWKITSDDGATFSADIASHANHYISTPVYTFCIQLFQTTGSPYTVSALNGAPVGGADAGSVDLKAAQQMQGLVDAFWNKIDFNNSSPFAYTFGANKYNANEVAAAFQLSVWEIEYDGGLTPGNDSYNLGGTFGADSGSTNFFTGGVLTASTLNGQTSDQQLAINLANAWLNSTAWSIDTSVSSIALESGTYQDQLYGMPNNGSGNIQPTPLPASLPAGLTLLAGLAAFRKFRKSRA